MEKAEPDNEWPSPINRAVSERARQWKIAEVLASRDAMLALWLIARGFRGSREDLAQEIAGKRGRAARVLDDLCSNGFIHYSEPDWTLSDLGSKTLEAIDNVLAVNKVATRSGMMPIKQGDVVRLKQVKSGAGYQKRQRQTLRGLGLRRVNHEVEHKASRSLIGMVNSIPHLVHIVSTRTARNQRDPMQANLDLSVDIS